MTVQGASYNTESPTDRDYVRLLSGDRNMDAPVLLDAEIDMLLADEPNKYFAAAAACSMILNRRGGLVEKQVEDLRLRWTEGNAGSVYADHIKYLRERGARETLSQPAMFTVLGNRRRR